MKDTFDTLKCHPFFEGLEERHIRDIASCSRELEYAEDQCLYRAGEPAQRLYVVHSGCVALQHGPASGSLPPLLTVGEGEVLGWSWLAPPGKWACTARCLEPTRVTEVDVAALAVLCEQDCELGYRLYRTISATMQAQLARASAQVADAYAKLGSYHPVI